ncbi:hypothetical protein, partial [Burkholderia sp. BCCCDS04]|uniref:hypothetical protein n=1 Tax=Burkholderia sp. BCCCDS04 TaxID=3390231 RepID=UPI003D2EA8B5
RRAARGPADAAGRRSTAAAALLTAARAASYGMARTCARYARCAVRASTVGSHTLHELRTL